MSLKVTDVLNRFNGVGDVSVCLKQAHLAKSLLKSKDLFTFIYIKYHSELKMRILTFCYKIHMQTHTHPNKILNFSFNKYKFFSRGG